MGFDRHSEASQACIVTGLPKGASEREASLKILYYQLILQRLHE